MHIFGRDVSDLSVDEINSLFREHASSRNGTAPCRSSVVEQAINRVQLDILRHIDSAGGTGYAAVLESQIEQLNDQQKEVR
ncbi:MAG: hypothetical protein EA399_00680 [Desulfovibrionales bacterium]|nr:MAG: hypothetical protein EA399_00680 [Desulfovibrionales bacterium]